MFKKALQIKLLKESYCWRVVVILMVMVVVFMSLSRALQSLLSG
ncbi:hypothetical protein OIU74_020705 [Salix koriyanagi]|uniref:Uncharacterized protein n=1 Tax=Salix koriyanagi TaxID=2511006 RepID=A0A9Q0P6N0_9ROSI|nr:hypothetical protein OIU74_020705 [Salix koriyanagi]